MSGAAVETLREALTRTASVVAGPLAASEIAGHVVERVHDLAGGRPAAVPGDDPVLERYGVVAALAAAGCDLVTPDRPDWREAIAVAPVGVTGCAAAAADPGTIGLACGPGAPRAVSLAPDVHLCIVPVDLVEAEFGDALARALAAGVPANLVWISGPSRSADIEKRITLGVHGPRTLEVVFVDG